MAPKKTAKSEAPKKAAKSRCHPKRLAEANQEEETEEAEPNADLSPKSGLRKRPSEPLEQEERPKLELDEVFLEVKKEELMEEEEEEQELSWHDLVPMPRTALSGRKKFKSDAIVAKYVSYPWREESGASDWHIMQSRSGDLLKALSADPSAAEQALAEEIDIDACNTRLQQVDEMIQDLIDEQLEAEDLMGPKGDSRVQLANHRRCPYDLEDFDVVDAALGVKTEKEEAEVKDEFREDFGIDCIEDQEVTDAEVLLDVQEFPGVQEQEFQSDKGRTSGLPSMLPIRVEPSSSSSGCREWPADIPLPDMDDMPDHVDIPSLEMEDVPLPGEEDPLREESLPHVPDVPLVPQDKLVSRNDKPARPLPDSLPSYRQVAVQRWQSCSELVTATLILHAANVHPNTRRSRAHIKENAAHGNPHKRASNQVLHQHGMEWPKTQAGEMECVEPDLSFVPDEVARVKADEMIFTVAVCDKSGIKHQEFDILSSQTLHDLRDAFYFVSDYTLDAQTRVESACMYIDGIFYSDMRSERSIDYAVPLIEHLQKAQEAAEAGGDEYVGPRLREYESRSMAIRLGEIERIPFGERCLFIRQGDIEHNMYFTGLRRFNFSCDCPFEREYPILIFVQQHAKRYCWACGQNQSIWTVRGSVRVPRDPLYFCHLCFNHFFKNKEGELIKPVEYQVYPYFHD